MDKQTDEEQLKNENPERTLEAMLLEGMESGEATPFTRSDFDKIKERGTARLKAKKHNQNSL